MKRKKCLNVESVKTALWVNQKPALSEVHYQDPEAQDLCDRKGKNAAAKLGLKSKTFPTNLMHYLKYTYTILLANPQAIFSNVEVIGIAVLKYYKSISTLFSLLYSILHESSCYSI